MLDIKLIIYLFRAKHGDMVVVRVNPNLRSQTGSLVGKIGKIVETAASAAYNISAELEALDESTNIQPVPTGQFSPGDSGIFGTMPPGLTLSDLDDNDIASIPPAPSGDELDELSAMWDKDMTISDQYSNPYFAPYIHTCV